MCSREGVENTNPRPFIHFAKSGLVDLEETAGAIQQIHE